MDLRKILFIFFIASFVIGQNLTKTARVQDIADSLDSRDSLISNINNKLDVDSWTMSDSGIVYNGGFRADTIYTQFVVDQVDTSEILDKSIPLRKLKNEDWGDIINQQSGVVIDENAIGYDNLMLDIKSKYSQGTDYRYYDSTATILNSSDNIFGGAWYPLVSTFSGWRVPIIYDGSTLYGMYVPIKVEDDPVEVIVGIWDENSSEYPAPSYKVNKVLRGGTGYYFFEFDDPITTDDFSIDDVFYAGFQTKGNAKRAVYRNVGTFNSNVVPRTTKPCQYTTTASAENSWANASGVTYIGLGFIGEKPVTISTVKPHVDDIETRLASSELVLSDISSVVDQLVDYSSLDIIASGDFHSQDGYPTIGFLGWRMKITYTALEDKSINGFMVPRMVRASSGTFEDLGRWGYIEGFVVNSSTNEILGSHRYEIPNPSVNQLDSIWFKFDTPIDTSMMDGSDIWVGYGAIQSDGVTCAQMGYVRSSNYTAGFFPDDSQYKYASDTFPNYGTILNWTGWAGNPSLHLDLIYAEDYTVRPHNQIIMNESTISNIGTSNFNENLDSFLGSQSDTENPYRLILPDTVYLAGGLEANIYFDNIVLGAPSNLYFDVINANGSQFEKNWRHTPLVTDVGEQPLTINLFNYSNENVGTASTVMKYQIGDTLERGKTILCIGDSRTAGDVWTSKLGEYGGDSLKFIGTQDPTSDTRHEGWGGRTYSWFANTEESPFVYSGVLDFQQYLDDNSFDVPDLVVMALGTNDLFGATDGTDYSSVLNACQKLIDSLYAINNNIEIGLIMETPPSNSQDAFGYNYTSSQTTWQYKRNIHRLNENLKSIYGVGGTGVLSHVSLIPAYLFLDTENNVTKYSVPFNAHNSDTYMRESNGVHEAASGYYQKADAVFGWVRNKVGGYDEYLSNRTFDSNITGWTVNDSPITAEWVTSYGGDSGLYHVVTNTETAGATQSNLDLDAGKYTYRARVHLVSSTGSARLSFRVFASTYVLNKLLGTTPGIYDVEYEFEILEAQEVANSYFWLLQTNPGDLEFYIDSASLTRKN